MSDLRKAAEMVLEALETLWGILDDIDTASDIAKENDTWYRKRVEALQKKRWDTTITTDGYKLKGGPVEALRQALTEPEQEPVAWGMPRDDGTILDVICPEEHAREPGNYTIPLYTAPPKREWVGLTDEDIEDEWRLLEAIYLEEVDPEGYYGSVDVEFARAIESKLREKNT